MKRKAISEDLISTTEAAVILGVIPRRVQALVAEGRLVPVMRVGRAMLFRRGDVTGFRRLKPGRPVKANDPGTAGKIKYPAGGPDASVPTGSPRQR